MRTPGEEGILAARQAQKRAGVPTERREEALRAYTVNVAVIPTAYMVALGLAKPIKVGDRIPTEKRTIYGTSLADAKKRAGIE
jgi:hypothetical protein